jgi:CheY-like chemotaxis protein
MAASTLLLVDDDPNDRSFALDAIASCGGAAPSVREVADGRAAIDYLAGRGAYASRAEFPTPSLVILDIKMPRVDGFDVLTWIRSEEKLDAVPVIMLSGSAQPGDIRRAFKLGANAFMVKPASLQRLKEMMRAVVDFWFGCNVTPMSDWG